MTPQPFSLPSPDSDQDARTCRVLLGCTGSVASVKAAPLCERLLAPFPETNIRFEVVVVASDTALRFIDTASLPSGVRLYTDSDEWRSFTRVGDPILHIELRRWADVCVVAPASANTLAKLAAGMCDTLLLETLRAWPHDLETSHPSKPVLICPAMNTHMYEHPLTRKHLDTLTNDLGYEILGPIAKMLACGDLGIGGMTEVDDIVQRIRVLASTVVAARDLATATTTINDIA
ncbi:hypothetical protein PYCC9005_005929 [Savitreella phatthalungensis]